MSSLMLRRNTTITETELEKAALLFYKLSYRDYDTMGQQMYTLAQKTENRNLQAMTPEDWMSAIYAWSKEVTEG